MRNLNSHWSLEDVVISDRLKGKLESVADHTYSMNQIATLQTLINVYRADACAHENSAKIYLVNRLLQRVRRRLDAGKPFAVLLTVGRKKPNEEPTAALVRRAAFERIQLAALTLEKIRFLRSNLLKPASVKAQWVRYVEWALENTKGGKKGDQQSARHALQHSATAVFNEAGECDENSSQELLAFLKVVFRIAGAGPVSRNALLKQR